MENVVVSDFSKEMKPRYLDYAMNVITDRSLPDVRDGLKPVHRRILYDMYNELKITYDKPYKKSARIVGDTLGKYHPHGDSSIYMAMVRMAQDFSLRYPLIDGHGNWGSIDGDSAAAMRYTEARLSKITNYILQDIDKNTVDFKPNFDGEEIEPAILPSRIPNLIINGADGIAVGLATHIPSHNLNEIIDAIIYQIDNSNCEIEDLLKYVRAPDFCTGCDIINPQDMKELYTTGKGKIVMRANYHMENIENDNNKYNKMIVFTTIPYQINKSKLIMNIAELVDNSKNKIFKDVFDIRDESDKETGLRIVIELKDKANEQLILHQLFKKTKLQENYDAEFNALVNKEPKTLNLKEILQHYIDFQKEIILKRSNFDLQKIKKRIPILQGLKIAIDKIDYTVRIIKQSKNISEAKINLISNLKINEIQAKAILDLKLQRLTSIDKENINIELKELNAQQEKLNNLINNENILLLQLKKDLLKIKKEFGDNRRSKIIYEDSLQEIKEDTLIEDYSTYCILTKDNYLKKLLKKSDSIKLKENDSIIYQTYSSNKATLLLFSNLGNCYKLYEYELDEDKPSSLGQYLPSILDLDKDEKIISMISTDDYKGKLIEIFENGNIASINLNSFKTKDKRTKLKNALCLKSKLVKMYSIEKDIDILLKSSLNKVLITNTSIINSKGSKNTQGVSIMKSKNNSTVIMAELLDDINTDKIENIDFYKNSTGKGVGIYQKKNDIIELK